MRAQAVPPSADPVPAHDTFTVVSRVLGESRRINVHTPVGYAVSPSMRFPVLYMPDGGIDEDFPHVVNTVDSLIARRAIQPVIVVGIPNTERRRDLTGPTRVKTDSAIAPRVGGSAAFRRFIRDELFPIVAERYRITDERSIVGESLAGLFVVEVFTEDPSMFRNYIALDPSLWWNGGALVDTVAARLTSRGNVRRTIYLSTSNVPEISAATARLVSAFQRIEPRGISLTHIPRPELTHATIYRRQGPAALAYALRW